MALTQNHSTAPQAREPISLDQDSDLRKDLNATLAARQELGTAYDPELIDGFLRRLDRAIDARIQQRSIERPPVPAVRHDPTRTVAVALGLAIPLIAIGGGIAGGVGIVAVLALIAFLVVYLDRQHR